jgi:hypothetical protein
MIDTMIDTEDGIEYFPLPAGIDADGDCPVCGAMVAHLAGNAQVPGEFGADEYVERADWPGHYAPAPGARVYGICGCVKSRDVPVVA